MNLVPIQYLNDGIVQQVTCSYTSQNMQRRLGASKSSTSFDRVVKLQLPQFLNPLVWVRHNYTFKDVQTTLEYFSAIHLWQYAYLCGITMSNSAVKISFTDPQGMIFGAKSIVIRKLMKYIEKHVALKPNVISVLDTRTTEHVPPIPVHQLLPTDWDKLCRLAPATKLKYYSVFYYPCTFRWQEVDWVPLWTERRDCIYTIRVVRRNVFDQAARHRRDIKSICAQPVSVFVKSEEYCGLDEVCLFTKPLN